MLLFIPRFSRALQWIDQRARAVITRMPRRRTAMPRNFPPTELTPHRVRRNSSPRAHASLDWLIPREEVEIDPKPFATGSFARLHLGKWLGSRVVIKCVDVRSDEDRSAFLREAEIWQSLRHLHIVPFFGICLPSNPQQLPNEPYFFVCKEATNGNLPSFLYRESKVGRSLAWRMLRDAALGLLCLHQRGFVHGDLKGNNVLVSKAGVAMLTDFGLSRRSSPNRTSHHSEALGAFQWKAPELLGANSTSPTFESDMYAFGMCVVEAIRGGAPWGDDIPDAAVRHQLLRTKNTVAKIGLQGEPARIMMRPSAFIKNDHWEFVKQLCAFDPAQRLKLPDAIAILDRFAAEEAAQETIRTRHSSIDA